MVFGKYAIEKLDYLIVLAEEQSITRAASRLFLSQPALTSYLNRLEEELGVKLFDRNTTPIKITKAGVCYIAEMKKLRNHQHKLLSDLKRLDYDPELTLTIGIGRNRASIWLSRILPGIYARYPDAHLRIAEDRDEYLAEKVGRGMLDVGIMEAQIQHSALTFHPLVDEPHTFITNSGNPHYHGVDLSGNGQHRPLNIKPSGLDDQIFICPSINGDLNAYTQQIFSIYSINPREILYISNSATAYQLAVKGLGVTYMSVYQADIMQTPEKPLYMMPGGRPIFRKVYAVYEDTNMTALKLFFIAHSYEVMQKYSARR